MDIRQIMKDKSAKGTERIALLIGMIDAQAITIQEIAEACKTLRDPETALCMQAVEEVTNAHPERSTIEYLVFANSYVPSKSNSVKREAARVIGNIAHLYPDELDGAIEALLKNANDDSIVVRWSAAYALSRIALIPKYANSALYEKLLLIAQKEENSGVKNVYAKMLKKKRV